MRKLQIMLIYILLVILACLIYLRVQVERQPTHTVEPVDAEASEPWELPQYAYANEKMAKGWRAALLNHDIWAFNDVDTHVQTIIYNADRTIYRGTDFIVNGYCGCPTCGGIWSENRPNDIYGNELVYGAYGRLLKSGYSVAVDSSVIPYDSNVYLNGRSLIAEDAGSRAHQIKVYWATHDLALAEPDHNTTRGATVWWSNDIFTQDEISYIEESLQTGHFFNLNAAGKTLEDALGGEEDAADE